MRVLLHSRNAAERPARSLFCSTFPAGLDFETVGETALKAAAAHLGQNDLLPVVLVADDDLSADLALIRSLRKSGFRGAIVVLAASKVATALLNAGADDVMVTPADPAEMLARLSAVTRRSHGIPAEAIELSDLTIYMDGRHPEVAGQSLPLSAREYQILRYLALNAGRVVPKAAIYDALYALCPMPPFDKIIDVYICRLRAKFAKSAAQGGRFIKTVPGRGYLLTAPTDV